jgi:hypothetical protein
MMTKSSMTRRSVGLAIVLCAAACGSGDAGSTANRAIDGPAGRIPATAHSMRRNTGAADVAAPPPAEGVRAASTPAGASPIGPAFPGPGNQISYHGGTVMLKPNVYVIWYGTWLSQASTVVLVEDYLSRLGASPYWAIDNTYTDATGNEALGFIFQGSYLDGRRDANPDIFSVVQDAIFNRHLPDDTNGIYLVITSADVAVDGINENGNDCAWHTHDTLGISPYPNIAYGWVGQATSDNFGCQWHDDTPNGPVPLNTPNGAINDTMITALTHELAEAQTDPNLDGWYGSSAERDENGDKCAWRRQGVTQTSSGAVTNFHLGTHDFFIQPLWVNGSGGYCGLSNDARRVAIFQPQAPLGTAPLGTINGTNMTCHWSQCDFLYPFGSNVVLTATPPTGYVLQSWVGCDSVIGNQCTVVPGADRVVSAYYKLSPTCQPDPVCYSECVSDCGSPPQKGCLASCKKACTVCQ